MGKRCEICVLELTDKEVDISQAHIQLKLILHKVEARKANLNEDKRILRWLHTVS